MSSWTRLNLLLAVLLGALVVADQWAGVATANGPLTPLDPDEISSLRVERADRMQLALTRTTDGWTLEYPAGGAVSGQRVAPLLALARAPVFERFPVSRDLAAYGLDPPQAVLLLDRQRLLFGGREPTQQGRYVLVGDQIAVIDDVYFNLLTLPARHFTGE
ncbi:MAG: hypothetical protein H6955_06875 [Chromatiaceae bacterium]|nr:hypothetical protein [Chromatiaceae bacterium]